MDTFNPQQGRPCGAGADRGGAAEGVPEGTAPGEPGGCRSLLWQRGVTLGNQWVDVDIYRYLHESLYIYMHIYYIYIYNIYLRSNERKIEQQVVKPRP